MAKVLRLASLKITFQFMIEHKILGKIKVNFNRMQENKLFMKYMVRHKEKKQGRKKKLKSK